MWDGKGKKGNAQSCLSTKLGAIFLQQRINMNSVNHISQTLQYKKFHWESLWNTDEVSRQRIAENQSCGGVAIMHVKYLGEYLQGNLSMGGSAPASRTTGEIIFKRHLGFEAKNSLRRHTSLIQLSNTAKGPSTPDLFFGNFFEEETDKWFSKFFVIKNELAKFFAKLQRLGFLAMLNTGCSL